MNNFIELLTKAVAIAEVIIQATKSKVKLRSEIYSSVILLVVGILSIAYDIIFNNPQITSQLIFTYLGFEGLIGIIPQIGFDKVKSIYEIIKTCKVEK